LDGELGNGKFKRKKRRRAIRFHSNWKGEPSLKVAQNELRGGKGKRFSCRREKRARSIRESFARERVAERNTGEGGRRKKGGKETLCPK